MQNLPKTDPMMQEILQRAFEDQKFFNRTIMPDRFFREFSSLHDEIYEAIEGPHKKVAIAAPRGFGKSTTVNVALPAKKILYREKNFIVPISCTAKQAIFQAEDLKQELITNQMVKQFFGGMRADSRDEYFSKETWVTSTGTMVLPRGAGQQVRGLRFRTHRPDLIIADDLEDSEAVLNEENRKKTKEWFFSDVVNSVDLGSDQWKILVIGTILHEDALLENLLEDDDWYSIRLELCNDDYKSNWPDFMNDQAVKALADTYREKGMLDVFYREFRNIPISKEDAIFKQEYFRYYDETDAEFQKIAKRLEHIILVDPAKTVKLHSADSAVVGIGVDVKTSSIYVRDVVAGKMYPDQLYANALGMAARLRARAIGLEVTSLNEFITFPFKNEMIRTGQVYPLVELHARAKKEERIAAMVPFYRNGFVFHNTKNNHQLEEQLLTFPRCKRFDIIDALAYFVEMLDVGQRFFGQDYDDDVEEEYAELEDDYEMGALANWRIL